MLTQQLAASEAAECMQAVPSHAPDELGETAATRVERLRTAQEAAGSKARADVARAEADVARKNTELMRAELGEERRARLTADSARAELHAKLEAALLDAASMRENADGLARQLEAAKAGAAIPPPAPPASERRERRERRGRGTSKPRPVCAPHCCVM